MTHCLKTVAVTLALATFTVAGARAMDAMAKVSHDDCMKKAQMEKDPTKMAALQKQCNEAGSAMKAGDAMKASNSMMKKTTAK